MARRGGFTLIELLVVVLIVLLITAVAIPVVAPAVQGRRAREASRELSTMIAAVRDRAIATGRPCGLWIERVPDRPDVAFLVSQCEVPPIFTGDSTQSRVTLGYVPPEGTNGNFPRPLVCMPVEYNSSSNPPKWDFVNGAWDNLIHEGDLIKFNLQGHTYLLRPITLAGQQVWTIGTWVSDPNNNKIADPSEVVFHENHSANPLMLPPRSAQSPPEHTFPFQITRMPKKGAGRPLQFPGGMVLDLNYSGEIEIGGGMPFFTRSGYDASDPSKNEPYQGSPMMAQNDASEIAIVFAPNGSLDHVYAVGGYQAPSVPLGGGDCYQPTSPIYLLIGKQSNVPLYGAPPAFPFKLDEDVPNWLDPESIWLTINPITGLVSTSENIPMGPQLDANGDGEIAQNEYPSQIAPYLRQARGFAVQSSSQGGR